MMPRTRRRVYRCPEPATCQDGISHAMLRRVTHLAVLRNIVNWLRRAGPLGSLLAALASVQVLFFGCIEFSEGRWAIRRVEPLAPVATAPDRQIRVRLLGRSAKPNAEISITAPFAINNASSGAALLAENSPLDSAVVRPSGAQAIQLGPKTIPCGDIVIVPVRDAAVVLNGQTYRGRLRIQRASGGLVFMNFVDMESYVRGVLR